jgi:hypothetical protein
LLAIPPLPAGKPVGYNRSGAMEHDLSQVDANEVEAVNTAEELLIKARRVAQQIGDRVKDVINLDGSPTLHAPGVETGGIEGDAGLPPPPEA